jgi:hypothetical protein
LLIVRREKDIEPFPDHFRLLVAKDSRRAGIPTGHSAVTVGANDGGVDGAINDLAP